MTDLSGDTTTHDLDRGAERRLAALLNSKPPTDQVSLAAWWFVASSLESAVPVRRCAEGVEVLSPAALIHAASRAQMAARAALEELPAHVVSQSLAMQTAGEPAPRLRSTMRALALLVVTPRVTTAQQLSDALVRHGHAVSRCLPPVGRT